MTANVTRDRRVTVPTLWSTHTVFVDGSRLCWALLSPVHERSGYWGLVPDRIQGDAVIAAFDTHGPVQDHVPSLSARPIVPTVQPCAVLAAVKAWPANGRVCRTRVATASLDGGVCARRPGLAAGRDEETATGRTKKLTREAARRGRPGTVNSSVAVVGHAAPACAACAVQGVPRATTVLA